MASCRTFKFSKVLVSFFSSLFGLHSKPLDLLKKTLLIFLIKIFLYSKSLLVIYFKYCLLFCCLVARSCPAFATPWSLQAPLSLWDSSAKNTRVSCHFFLQEIFPTQGLNPYFLHWQADSLLLSRQGNPILNIAPLILYCLYSALCGYRN